jgi:two-component system chemotaxis sensor kinase CheA
MPAEGRNVAYNPVATYLQEAEELIAVIEQSALSLGESGGAEEINQLFRAFHTIKGSGAMFGFDGVASFTHHVESMLEKARSGALAASPRLVDLVLKAVDHIRELLAGSTGDGPHPPPNETLIAAIEEFANGGPATDRGIPEEVAPEADRAPTGEQSWRIQFRPSPTLFACGGNPIALFRQLGKLGVREVTAHTEDVPALDVMIPDRCYVWWTLTLRTAATENDIRDVFIFVEDDSKLEIQCVLAEPKPDAGLPQESPEDEPRLAPAAARRAPDGAKESTVRVPSERLDRLVNLVGELVMNHSRLAQAALRHDAPELSNPIQELERLVAELRDDVLGIRMLPIGTLFGRFTRLVHDLSAQLGKEAGLVTAGAETELDKSILDQLGEPLVHCLRNCLDHSVEPPEERVAKGKPRRATIRLSADHIGSHVVISVEDDGRGIDRDAVRAKAIEKQLIARDAVLSEKEISNLILLPGFSTARAITGVSGRGVGMDAIKRQIDLLRGSLSLASEPGTGTRVSMALPLTLAIIDGLLVEIGPDRFILPMAEVTENVELTAAERSRRNGRNVIAVRGELVPYVDLRSTFGSGGERPANEKIVIVRHEGERVGLVVDRVLGTHQTVIQSLGRFFRDIHVISGATVMGDGRVALIMDIAAGVRLADRADKSGAATKRKVRKQQ